MPSVAADFHCDLLVVAVTVSSSSTTRISDEIHSRILVAIIVLTFLLFPPRVGFDKITEPNVIKFLQLFKSVNEFEEIDRNMTESRSAHCILLARGICFISGPSRTGLLSSDSRVLVMFVCVICNLSERDVPAPVSVGWAVIGC